MTIIVFGFIGSLAVTMFSVVKAQKLMQAKAELRVRDARKQQSLQVRSDAAWRRNQQMYYR